MAGPSACCLVEMLAHLKAVKLDESWADRWVESLVAEMVAVTAARLAAKMGPSLVARLA